MGLALLNLCLLLLIWWRLNNFGNIVRKNHFYLLLLSLGFSLFGETPDAMWRTAFKAFDQAEIHLKKGDIEKSDDEYNAALAKFLKIRVDYPQWEITSVNYRINECKDRLAEIKEKRKAPENKKNLSSLLGTEKLRAERDRYKQAMLIAYKKYKKFEKEAELMKALLRKAQKDAGDFNQNDSFLEQAVMDKRKLELEIKSLKEKLEANEKNKDISAQIKVAEVQQRMDKLLLDSQKEKRELQDVIVGLKKTLLEKQNQYQDQKKLYNQMKEISADSEKEKTKYVEQLGTKDKQIINLKKQLADSKSREINLNSAVNLAQQSLLNAEKREKESNAKLLDQLSELNKIILAEKSRADKFEQSYKLMQTKNENNNQVNLVNTQIIKLKKELESLQNTLKNERKLAAIKSVNNEKKILAQQKKTDKILAERNDLEIKLNDYIRQNKKLSDDATKAGVALNQEQLKNSQLKKQLIERETSYVNNLKNTTMAQEKELVDLKRKLKEQQDINNIYSSRLESSSTSLLALKQQLKELSEDAKSQVKNKKSNSNELALIKKIEESESLNKKLNSELISLRERYVKLNKMSGAQDDEIIGRYLKVKKSYDALKIDYKKLAERNLGEINGGSKSDSFVNESSENVKRKVETYIYDAYKASANGKTQAALGLYAKALELDTENLDALMRTGVLYYQLGQLSEAERYLKRAFYQNPDDTNILIPLAMSVLDQADYHMGISFLSRAVALKPDNDELRVNLGVTLQALGWEKAALAEMEKAYELNAKNAQTALNLSVLYLSQTPKKVNSAREMYEKALALGAQKSPVMEELLK